VCLDAGNTGFKQALDNVVEAARSLASMPVLFVLMGDGNQRAELERLVNSYSLSNVVFLPFNQKLISRRSSPPRIFSC
jgi:glycosyltransferase involved in cell wall biosynthesis